jgi:RNA recognition motif-containing protein
MLILLHQELIERRRIAGEPKQQLTTPITSPTHIIIHRYYGPSFRALVRNLPLTVTSSQVQHFLSKHGKVSSAEVLYYKKSKRSQGIALLTMSTIHANIEDALEALNDLFLHGYRLNVVLVKAERQRLRISSTEAAHQHI